MKTRKIDLNLLTIFEAVYETRNQSRAAERLYMTQPSVSVAISKLRSIVGDRLFLVGPGGLVPTKKADTLYKHCHASLVTIRHEVFELDNFDPQTTFRTFTLAVSASGGAIYAPHIHRLMKAHAPNARLAVRSIDPEGMIPDVLHDHSVDAAIHYDTFDDTRLKQDALDDDQLILVASKNHPRIQQEPTVEDCIREEFVGLYQFLDKAYDAAIGDFFDVVEALTVLQLPNPMVVMSTVSESELLAVTSRRIAESTRERFDLNLFRIPARVASIRSYLIWSKSIEHDPGNKWFLGLIREAQKQMPTIERRAQT